MLIVAVDFADAGVPNVGSNIPSPYSHSFILGF